jgi:hypothetical protein
MPTKPCVTPYMRARTVLVKRVGSSVRSSLILRITACVTHGPGDFVLRVVGGSCVSAVRLVAGRRRGEAGAVVRENGVDEVGGGRVTKVRPGAGSVVVAVGFCASGSLTRGYGFSGRRGRGMRVEYARTLDHETEAGFITGSAREQREWVGRVRRRGTRSRRRWSEAEEDKRPEEF